jgi:hypothetical protein
VYVAIYAREPTNKTCTHQASFPDHDHLNTTPNKQTNKQIHTLTLSHTLSHLPHTNYATWCKPRTKHTKSAHKQRKVSIQNIRRSVQRRLFTEDETGVSPQKVLERKLHTHMHIHTHQHPSTREKAAQGRTISTTDNQRTGSRVNTTL